VVQKNLVSVTSIKVASDLSFCKIYISVFGKSYDACKAFLAIQASSSYIRKELSNKLKLRHTPKLEFLKDKTLEQGAKIERMLQALMSLKK
jgi:ribosome-binding factor A